MKGSRKTKIALYIPQDQKRLANDHGNPSSGELYYGPQSGQANSYDTIFREQPPELLCKKSVIKNFAKFTENHQCRSLIFNVVGLRSSALF